MSYTAFKIVRDNALTWHFEINNTPEVRGGNAYSASFNDLFVSFAHKFRGSVIAANVPYNVISYEDNYDSNSQSAFSSPLSLVSFLMTEGFFGQSSSGSGGATAFTHLVDTFTSYIGLGSQVLVVSPDEVGIISQPISNVSSIKDLSDWFGGNTLLPGKILFTSANVNLDGQSEGIVLVDPDNYVNTPIPYTILRLKAKGINPSTSEPNIEPYVLEVGDIVEGFRDEFIYWNYAKYNGGDITDRGNYTPIVLDQNNETKYISFGKINQTDFNPLPTSEVANLFNTSIAPIVISETQIPWVQVTVSGPSQPSVKHIYQFLPGKGNYGSGGATVTASMFRHVNTLGATQQDVENTGNTETINLGEVTNYITVLNSVGRDFTDENLQYFVKYTISGTSYFKIFIGTTYGMYGGTNTLQFTDEMWQDVVTSATPGVAGLRVTIAECVTDGVLQSADLIGANTVYMAISQANAGVVSGTHTLNPTTGEVSNSEFYAGALYQITFK